MKSIYRLASRLLVFISSKNAVVVWIPITGLKPSMGGLEIIPFQKDDLKIYKTKAGDKYESYADAQIR